MSAFLVSNATISKILDGIARPNPIIWDSGRMHEKSARDFDLLGMELLMMNHRALEARYGDPVPDGVEYTYPSQWSATTPVETLKALDCLLYQCCEGDINETPLYQRVSQWQREVAMAIIRKMPEYKSAPWDFPND